MKVVSKYVVQYLNDFFIWGQVSGDVEVILHNAKRVLSKQKGYYSLIMLTKYLTISFKFC